MPAIYHRFFPEWFPVKGSRRIKTDPSIGDVPRGQYGAVQGAKTMQPDSLIRHKLLCPWDTDKTKDWLIKNLKKKVREAGAKTVSKPAESIILFPLNELSLANSDFLLFKVCEDGTFSAYYKKSFNPLKISRLRNKKSLWFVLNIKKKINITWKKCLKRK